MNTLRLICLAIKYQWSAQRSNPANLIVGTVGMIVNNLIVLVGLWAMLFHGKPDQDKLSIYYIALNALVTISWGSICFFMGGLRVLGEYVEQGSLEPMLAAPRDPLILVGISQSSTPSLGDIIQGLGNFVVLCFIAPSDFVLRTGAFVFVVIMGFLALFIFAGSIPFFLRRGSAFAQFFVECNLSLSFYPTGKIFTDRARMFLYIMPAVATGVLPMNAVESGGAVAILTSITVSLMFLFLSIQFFRSGLKRYQSSSYVMARN